MEFLFNTVDQLNWWAVLIAAFVPFPIGFLWYSFDYGYGKRWAKMVGLKKSDIEKSDGMAMTFTVLAIIAVATAVVLASLMQATGTMGLVDSAFFGIIIGVVLRGGAHFIHNGFARRPAELTMLDVSHDVVSITAMTVILGVLV